MVNLPKVDYFQYWNEDGSTAIMSSNQFLYNALNNNKLHSIRDLKKLTYKEACKLYDSNPELFKETKINISKSQVENQSN